MNSLKSFSFLDQATFQNIDIHECIENVLILLESECGNRINVIKNFGNTPKTNCYPSELSQVFMHLLTLKNKSILNIEDLKSMIRTLGIANQGHFRQVGDLLTGVRVEEAPLSTNGIPGLLKFVYYLRFKEFDESIMPLIETFVTHLEQILDTWISEATVQMKSEIQR